MKTISKILSIVLCLTMIAALFVVGASAASTTDTLEASSLTTYENGAGIESATAGSVSFAFAKASATNGPKVYITNNVYNIRTYNGCTITISVPAGKKISKIVFTATGASYTVKGSSNVGSLAQTDATTTVSITSGVHTSVVITTSATCRIASIAVTYADEGDTIACEHTYTWTKTYLTCTETCSKCGDVKTASDNHTAGDTCTRCNFAKPDLSTNAGVKAAIDVLASGEKLEGITLTGKVTSFSNAYSPKYGNVGVKFAVDTVGEILAYRAVAAEGTDIDISKLCVTDTITVTGNIVLYQDAPQFEQGNTITAHTVGEHTYPTTSAAVITAAYALADGESLPYCFTLTGKVIAVTEDSYKNPIIAIDGDNDHPILCYKISKGNADPKNVKIGDEITVAGVIKNYGGTIEFNGCELDAIEAHECQNEWKVDENGHWEECSVCGTQSDVCDKEPTWVNTDANDHWKACECGYTTTKATHNHTGDYTTGNEGHYQLCECGHKSTEEACADGDDTDKLCDKCGANLACVHEWKPVYDNDNHFEKCDKCGDKKNTEAHTPTHEEDDKQHWDACECGWEGTKEDHKLVWVNTDTANHWQTCECGYTTAKEGHTLHDNKCECGYVKAVNGYFKVTDGKLTDGEYIIVISDTKVAAGALDGTWVSAVTPEIKGNQVVNPEGCVWTLKVNGSKVTITDENGKTLYHSKTNIVEGDTAWNWKYEDGKFYFFNDDAEKPRYFSSVPTESGANRFRAYYLTLEPDSYGNFYYAGLTLYKYGANANTGDSSVVSVAIAAAVIALLGGSVVVMKKKAF